jgi:hypothetical protein
MHDSESARLNICGTDCGSQRFQGILRDSMHSPQSPLGVRHVPYLCDGMCRRSVEDVMALALSRECSGWIRLGSGLELVAFVPLDKTDIVVDQDLGLRDDAPLDLFQELHLQSRKFADTDTANPSISGVGPEAITQALCSDSGSRDKEAMDSKRADGKGRVERT